MNSLSGEMAERLKAPVLKTGDVKASVGSNPTLSATIQLIACAVGCIFLTWCLQEGETVDKMYADRETILALVRSGKFVPCSYLKRLLEFC